jgi:hypothetical protein
MKHTINLGAAVFYALLTFLTLNLLIFTTGTHSAGYDYFNFHWDMWWLQHVLTTHGLSVYETNNVFAPMVTNMGYHVFAAVWFPLWALIEPLIGTFAAINLIIVLGCWLNGFCVFVFMRREGIANGLALLAGAVMQTLPIVRYFYFNTHLNLMDWFWLPIHLMLLKQVFEAVDAGKITRVIGWLAVQIVALWGVGLTDLQFPIFTALVLIPYGLWRLWQSKHRGRIVVAEVAVLGVAVVLLWFLGPLRAMSMFRGTLAPGLVEDRPGIPFPAGFLSMSPTWTQWNTPSLGAFMTLFILISLVLSVSSWRRYMARERWLWFGAMPLPLTLSMGADIQIGSVTIPMPYRVLHALTNGMFGMPWRLAPVYVFAALAFCGMTWTPILKRRLVPLPKLAILGAMFLLLFADIRLFENGPLSPLPPIYDFYRAIGSEAEDPQDQSVLLEVPTGLGTGEVIIGDLRATQLQLYTIFHGKRTVNGFVSRAPVENFWWINTDDPMMAWLGQRRMLEPTIVAEQLRERIFSWPISYIVVHQDLIGKMGPTPQEILGFLNAQPDLVCPVWVEGDAVVYRTAWHPAGCPARMPPEREADVYQIDLGESGDEKYIGAGWHWQESVPGTMVRWAMDQAIIYVDLPAGVYRLTVSTQAFQQARELTVLVNGQMVGMVEVPADGLQPLEFTIPSEAIGDGRHITITLAAQSGRSADDRPLSVMVDWLRFTVVDP